MEKALIAMSGGVDSSVAACLMKEAGYECSGLTMKLFQTGEAALVREHSCCSMEDIEDAASVCKALGLEHFVADFSSRFEEKVIKNFVSVYKDGGTPNPCIQCNKYLKFSRIFEEADRLSARYIVTGHYARIVYDEKTGSYLLKKARDPSKDQTYVLYFLSQSQLSRIRFPLGELCKTEVRDIAKKYGFVNSDKPDSQDICFVKSGKYSDFIEEYSGEKNIPGNFVDKRGQVLGRHKGHICYTVGQRKGLGIAYSEPLYVTGKNVEENKVILGTKDELFTREVIVENCNFITAKDFTEPCRIRAKLRYRQPEQPCTAHNLDKTRVRLVFDQAQRAVTRGQSAVFYDGDTVLGGGIIRSSE